MFGYLSFFSKHSGVFLGLVANLWRQLPHWWKTHVSSSRRGHVELPKKLTGVAVLGLVLFVLLRVVQNHAIRTIYTLAFENIVKKYLIEVPFSETLASEPVYSAVLKAVFICVACLTAYAINRSTMLQFLNDLRRHRGEFIVVVTAGLATIVVVAATR